MHWQLGLRIVHCGSTLCVNLVKDSVNCSRACAINRSAHDLHAPSETRHMTSRSLCILLFHFTFAFAASPAALQEAHNSPSASAVAILHCAPQATFAFAAQSDTQV